MSASILTATALLLVALVSQPLGAGSPTPPFDEVVHIQFTDHASNDRDADWSPDGKWLAFVSGRSGHDDLWIKPVAGGDAIQVTDNAATDGAPRWSPDGSRLLFYSHREGFWGLWTVEPFGGEATTVPITTATDSVYGHGVPASWSPDGTRIVFAADRGGHKTLWIISTSGGEARQLTAGERDDWDPDWSPDGKWIAYNSASSVREPAKLWKVPSAGGAPRQLTTSLAGDYNPSWSPDGRWIAFARKGGTDAGDWEIWMLPAAGGTPARVTDTPSHDEIGPRWSPDATRLCFSREKLLAFGANDIVIADVEAMVPFIAQMTHQRIAGQVTRPRDGTAWADAPIRIREDEGTGVSETTTSTDGRYQAWLAPGSYEVTVGPHTGDQPVYVSLDPGEMVDGIDFTPEVATIAGTVTLPDGSPRPGVRVRVEDMVSELRREERTGADGRYLFWVAPGDYRISVVGADGVEPVEVGLEVGSRIESLDFATTTVAVDVPRWPVTAMLAVFGIGALACLVPLGRRRGRLAEIILSPGRAFQGIAEQPEWVGPFFLILVSVLIGAVAAIGTVVQMVSPGMGGMPAAMRLVTIIVVPLLTSAGVILGVYAAWFIRTGLIWLLARICGERTSFRRLLSVIGYAYLPDVLLGGMLMACALAFGYLEVSPAGPSPVAMPTSLAALLPGLGAGSQPLRYLLEDIEVFTLWSLILTAIGVQRAYGFGLRKAAVIVVLYWALVLGAGMGFHAVTEWFQELMASG